MFELETHDGIAVLTMAHGKANAMDTAFCNGLAERMEELAAGDARAVVLAAAGRIFSAGVDLPQLLSGGAPYVREFLPGLSRMLGAVLCHPKPVVAAVNGHAIAGGCLLAVAADRRLMARTGGRVGVPELRVGVPFPPLPVEIIRARVQPEHVAEVLLGGATFDPETALAYGFVDELVGGEALLTRAIAAARELAGVSAPLYALTKRMLLRPLLAEVERQEAAYGAEIDALWQDAGTLAAVAAYIEKTMPRK